MKLNEWYNCVPAFVGTFDVISIGRTFRPNGVQTAFDAARPPARTPITISVWSFDDTPKALQVLAAPPTPGSVVAYVPAVMSVGDALRLLDLPDEDNGRIQTKRITHGSVYHALQSLPNSSWDRSVAVGF